MQLDKDLSGLLRPAALVLDGAMEFGLEVEFAHGNIVDIRPHTGLPEAFVLSPAFVNAHSHLEYRGLQGSLDSTEYMPWIRELVAAKMRQGEIEVAADCLLAARENVAAGVGAIAEHSDRIGAASAMKTVGLTGYVFQEVVTFADQDRQAKLNEIAERMQAQAADWPGITISPHAPHTVDEQTLEQWSRPEKLFSIHVGETDAENEFFRFGTGPIAGLYASLGVPVVARGISVVEFLVQIGLANSLAQFVHGCSLTSHEIGMLAERGVRLAHCPRSNRALNCPRAKVRQMLHAGMPVGLGLDSAASSGPINMFSEMQATLRTARELGEPVSGDQVWQMATTGGADSIDMPQWKIEVGAAPPLIAIQYAGEQTSEDLILAEPSLHWVTMPHAK